jgi:Holliday junction resolvasome RuvABC endonuclease subunit
MPKKTPIILGINPGAKYLGLAVFRGSELRDWRIKVTKGKWANEKYRKILAILSVFIEQYSPDVFAIKRLNPSRSSAGLDRLVRKIIALSEKKGIRVYQYGIKELEAFFDPAGRSNKKKMAEIIALEYPVLLRELNSEKRNKNRYHLRMFEAVALGAMCFHQLDNSKQLKKYLRKITFLNKTQVLTKKEGLLMNLPLET